MTKLRIATALASLLLVAPLCYSATASLAPATFISLQKSVTVRGDFVGLADGGKLWYKNQQLKKGTVLSGTMQAQALTVTLPNEAYQALTVGRSFEVAMPLTNGHEIHAVFTPTQQAAGDDVVLVTGNIAYVDEVVR